MRELGLLAKRQRRPRIGVERQLGGSVGGRRERRRLLFLLVCVVWGGACVVCEDVCACVL